MSRRGCSGMPGTRGTGRSGGRSPTSPTSARTRPVRRAGTGVSGPGASRSAHGFPVTAYVLIMDRLGRMLLVHPAKADGPWHLPGGIVEPGESPLDAVRREVREELGLTFDTHIWQFLAVEWLQAARPERRDRLSFLFTGPRLYSGDDGHIVLQCEELDAWRWEYTGSALELLHPRLSARVARALRTHRAHPVSYLEARNEEATP
ncbi:NUDIX domain-containing protein [Streptomyces klenkii]|uniref:NUDIX domain-containing protein n=1 Tax=Streptomyces klenkii TaxID=1420899 RepID=UPI0036EB83AE